MASYGPTLDAELMQRRFPGARLVSSDGRGETYDTSLARLPSDARKQAE
jgi:hypothetical protein